YFGTPLRAHVAESSDEGALQFGLAFSTMIHEVARQSPDACFTLLFSTSNEMVTVQFDLGEQTVHQFMQAGVVVLQSSRESPQPPPDAHQVLESMAAAIAALRRNPPQEAALLQDPARLSLNRPFACRAVMLFYDVLLERKDAMALRWALSRSAGAAIP